MRTCYAAGGFVQATLLGFGKSQATAVAEAGWCCVAGGGMLLKVSGCGREAGS